mmetsp:Transcript_3179/g.8460  ORF Transcript_3179/g.8460 Transcript_3179/m.8460 type:complete len:296 (-) Transcript_3179:40-927(-)
MVLIHCKYKGEEHSFLYETTVEIAVKDLIKELVEVHNLRLRLQRLKSEGDDLASHGPCKPLDKQGLDEDIQAEADGIELPPRGPTYCKDPIGKRTGDAPVTPAQATLRKALDDAAAAASKKQVEAKHPLTKKELMEHIDLIRGAVMIAYPMGLPEYDPVRIDIEEDEAPSETPIGIDILDENAQLWWAGKQMLPGNKLSVHVGKNEKTKIVAKLTKKGSGAPQRENPVTPEEHKAMLAYYHKRQEEMKHLAQNDEDDYTNSAWANSRALKNHFSGVGGGGGVSISGLGGRTGFNH